MRTQRKHGTRYLNAATGTYHWSRRRALHQTRNAGIPVEGLVRREVYSLDHRCWIQQRY